MKLIDQTPFFKEDGSLSLADRARAVMKFGTGWIKNVEAQKPVIDVLERVLDKKFTLLRNIILPDLDAMIPFILVGPSGVYVMSVNPLPGVFSARGDQWGVLSGDSIRPQKPNLLTRTEQMARAIQVYLKRQGHPEVFVDAILLCSNPTTNVDSVRPIIRVVQRDALERFGVSIAQARLVLTPESAFNIVNILQTAPPPAQPGQAETAPMAAEPGNAPPPGSIPPESTAQAPDSFLPASGSKIPDSYIPPSNSQNPDSAPAGSEPASYQVIPPPPGWAPLNTQTAPPPAADSESLPAKARRPAITKKQWLFLAILAVVWLIILVIFAVLIARDFLPALLPVK